MHKIVAPGNYRQLIKIGPVDVCPIIDDVTKFPIFNSSVNWLNETFPGLIQKCPYTFFKITNGMFNLKKNGEYNFQPYPNGQFRSWFSFFDEIDSYIGEIWYHFEVDYKNNWLDI